MTNPSPIGGTRTNKTATWLRAGLPVALLLAVTAVGVPAAAVKCQALVQTAAGNLVACDIDEDGDTDSIEFADSFGQTFVFVQDFDSGSSAGSGGGVFVGAANLGVMYNALCIDTDTQCASTLNVAVRVTQGSTSQGAFVQKPGDDGSFLRICLNPAPAGSGCIAVL